MNFERPLGVETFASRPDADSPDELSQSHRSATSRHPTRARWSTCCLLLLIFFLITWNAARNENELDVKIPKASAAKEKSAPIGDVIVNVKADGNVVVNRRTPFRSLT